MTIVSKQKVAQEEQKVAKRWASLGLQQASHNR